jgi:hypothetical protein
LASCSEQQIAAHAHRPRFPEELTADGLERLFAGREPGFDLAGARVTFGERTVEATGVKAGQQLGIDGDESLNATVQLDEPSPRLPALDERPAM